MKCVERSGKSAFGKLCNEVYNLADDEHICNIIIRIASARNIQGMVLTGHK